MERAATSRMAELADRLDRWCGRINGLVEAILFVLGSSMAILVGVQVVFRYGFNHSIFWSEELARYQLVWLTFLGATVAYYRGVHPGIDLVASRVPGPGRRWLDILVHLLSLVLFAVMIVAGTRFAWFVRAQISPALGMPKWIILAVIPLSGAILFCHGLDFLLRELAARR